MDYIDRMRFDAIEDSYHESREPQLIGRCDVCGWPIYSGDKYEYTHNGLRHLICPPEKENDL
jgi:hypothetical protein